MSADHNAWAWIMSNVQLHGVALEDLTPGQIFALTRRVPCRIRCWRTGIAVDTAPKGRCPECGKPQATSLWERLTEEDVVG